MNFSFNKAKSDARDSKDRISNDLSELLAASEELLRKTAAHTGDGVDEARTKLQSHLRAAQGHAATWQKEAKRTAREVAHKSDEFVHDNPWKAIGIAALVGIAITFLASNSSKD